MILLGVSAGFGNSELGNLPLTALGLDAGWVNFPRPKTGAHRRCALWPETAQALRAYLTVRPEPKEGGGSKGLVFVTKYGLSWAKSVEGGPVSAETGKLLRTLGITRPGVGLSALRHTFRTAADEAKDQPAADFIMGHESSHMSTHYRERISDARPRAVADHVRVWLFGADGEGVAS